MFVNYGVNDRSKLKTYSLERAESSFAAYIYMHAYNFVEINTGDFEALVLLLE